MSAESVQVAVRLRPFNQREIERNAKLIINMTGQTTKISHPTDANNVKVFNFDYSYWSHDGFKNDSNEVMVPDKPTSIYASQQKVFTDLGQGVLNNALNGYNCSLFAYGQTGSGKSYSMIGYGNNKGIVPTTCNELFKIVESRSNESTKYGVQFSMLEIYNERIHDLLLPAKSSTSSGNLTIRESKNLGFFVQDLLKVPVGSYEQVEKRMNQGTSNRTIAATQMNATSSRAHTVITIEFNQIIKSGNTSNTKSSVIQLIDLAGSERADSTGATGDRLKEGASINKSLSVLGNVISALADSTGGNKNTMVPYRDSVLTKLLKNALGGNSKTVMIAALSPADINYDETLSTLRYADRVKQIKNVAIVNENPFEKIIRELREENERLKMTLNGQLPKDINTKGMSEEDIERLRKEIENDLKLKIQLNTEISNLQNSDEWQDKIKAADSVDEMNVKKAKIGKFPYISNINEDPQLNGTLYYFIETPKMIIGKLSRLSDDSITPIRIFGPGIQETHASITYNVIKKDVSIKPLSSDCVVKVNGHQIGNETEINLSDNDRIVFGSSNLYIFKNPFANIKSDVVWDWESVQTEIAEAEGFDLKDRSILESQIIEILPMVLEVNAISKEMNKSKEFSVLIIPEQAQILSFKEEGNPKVMIKMTNLINNNTWLMERSHFINRRYIIQELYERFLEGEDMDDISYKDDPFWEPTSDILVGIAPVFLQNLLYGIGINYNVNVMDYKGRKEGVLSLKIEPCDKDGVTLEFQDIFIENATELLKKAYYVKISIDHLSLFKTRFIHGSKVKFNIYLIEKTFETETSKKSLESDFNYIKIISWPSITKEHLDYFKDGTIIFCVYGIQKDTKQLPSNSKISMKQTKLHLAMGYDVNKMKTEKFVSQTINNRQARKLERLKQICVDWSNKPDEEQLFDPFYRAVCAITFSSENKFKNFATIFGKGAVLKKQLLKKKNAEKIMTSAPGRARTVNSRKQDDIENSEVCVTM